VIALDMNIDPISYGFQGSPAISMILERNSEIQGHESNEISPPDRIKDEYPSFIIEIAGEPTKGKRRWPSSDRREFPGNPSAAASSLSASSPNQTPAFPSRRYSRNFTTLGHTFVRLRQAGLPKPYQHLKKSKVMITRLTTGSGSAENV
jgi:hypothetical protein